MQEAIALAGIIGALSVGVVSPGPSFVMVARTTVATSRAHGVSAAFGMGVGGMLFAAAALLGLQAVFLAVPSVYLGLKVLGGCIFAISASEFSCRQSCLWRWMVKVKVTRFMSHVRFGSAFRRR